MSGRFPRDGLTQPFEGYPAYGAVHDVVPNQELRRFLFDYSRMADGVFIPDYETEEVNPVPGYVSDEEQELPAVQIIAPEGQGPDLVHTTYDSRKYYRIFNPESLGVSVVEMDPACRAARKARKVWEGHDFGAVEDDARNEIGRKLPSVVPRLFFTRVEGVGHRLPACPQADIRQKMALMPDTTRFAETLGLIDDEAAIIIGAIQRRIRNFTYPTDSVPHLTFSVFRSAAQPDKIVEVQKEANEYLAVHPVGVRLDDLTFRSKRVRNGRHH